MKAVVVYESLWGNTAEAARAIVEGLGEDARALSTSEATPEIVASADVVVAGAPIHIGRLSSDKTRARAQQRFESPDEWPDLPQPNLALPAMRDWLEQLAKRRGAYGAAFDTRSPGRWTGDAARRIDSALSRRGYRRLVKPTGFVVRSQSGPLAEGERERAVAWGREISRLASEVLRTS